MVHRQIQSSSFGRLTLPFLLLFLLVYVDARVIRCRSGGCANPAPLTQPLSLGQEAPVKLPEFPLTFPFSESFLNGPPAPVDPTEDDQPVQAPTAGKNTPVAPRRALAPVPDSGEVAPPRLPTDREVTSADVDAFLLQAQRYFRSQQTQRATGTHPMAGGAGAGTDVNGAAPGQTPSQPQATTSGPPPGQGDAGANAPGELGEPAGGFLG